MAAPGGPAQADGALILFPLSPGSALTDFLVFAECVSAFRRYSAAALSISALSPLPALKDRS